MKKNEILRRIIIEWIMTNRQLKNMNKYLFSHTELFEGKYIDEFKGDLYGFFAGKISRFQKDENRLRELMRYYNISDEIFDEIFIEEIKKEGN